MDDYKLKICPICGHQLLMKDGVLPTHTKGGSELCKGSSMVIREKEGPKNEENKT